MKTYDRDKALSVAAQLLVGRAYDHGGLADHDPHECAVISAKRLIDEVERASARCRGSRRRHLYRAAADDPRHQDHPRLLPAAHAWRCCVPAGVWCAVPMIKQVKFRHANQEWLALFEHHHINPAQGKGQPEKTPENLRITWSIRRLRDGVQDLCLSGHWSLERDVYSVDHMTEPAPRGLIKAAFARQVKTTPVSDERNTKCCSGITVARNGTISGRFCDICMVAKEQNAKVLAGIAERRRRLFDQEEEST